MSALEAKHLYRFYHAADDETLALQGVSLAVDAGEFVVVTGPSGSGKSTLVSCLAGLDVPDGGTVRLAGEPLSRRSEIQRSARRARAIGIVLQQGNLLDHLTVAENVALAQRLGGRVDRARVTSLLDRLGIAHRARARPAALSGGETARAGLAVALANDPQVVLADEPTGELDATTAGTVVALLRTCAELGAAVLVATHAQAVADAADRVLTMRDGRLTS